MEDAIRKIKDYLPLIALVPLLIGGFWQLVELASISSSYIRFFSVTQQLADGLLILFIFTLFYLTFLFIKKGLLSDFSFDTNKYEISSNKDIFLKLLLSVSVFCVSMYYLKEIIPISATIIEGASNGIISLGPIIFSLISIAVILMIVHPLFALTWVIIKRITKIEINLDQGKFQDFKRFVITILVIILLRFSFTTFFPVVHSAYIIPRNLTNLQYVVDKYSKENKISNKKDVRIVYTNDKYIFIQYGVNIEVVKSDYMFKSDK